MKQSPIMAWLVWAPPADERDYVVFADRLEAEKQRDEFDQINPRGEHKIDPLVIAATLSEPTREES